MPKKGYKQTEEHKRKVADLQRGRKKAKYTYSKTVKAIISCETCGKLCEKKQKGKRFCSSKCANKANREQNYPYTILVCPNCEKSFRRLSSKQIYCSNKCYTEHHPYQPRTGGPGKRWRLGKQFVKRLNCTFCGKEIYVSKARRLKEHNFCSVPCRAKFNANIKKSQRLSVFCANCNKEIRSSASRANRIKFCSNECFKASRRNPQPAHPERIQLKPKLVVEKSCQQCQVSFKTTNPEQQYCSKICYNVWNKQEKIRLTCETCGATWETTKCGSTGRFCSLRCFGLYQSKVENSKSRGRSRGGKREDLNQRYFRSRWEANYARFLNWLQATGKIIKWEYEVDTFEFLGIKRGHRFYTPDFKVFENDGSVKYHEVKGWMDPGSQTKLKRMTKYFPAVEIVVIDATYYKNLQKNMSKILPGWEN